MPLYDLLQHGTYQTAREELSLVRSASYHWMAYPGLHTSRVNSSLRIAAVPEFARTESRPREPGPKNAKERQSHVITFLVDWLSAAPLTSKSV